MTGKEIADKIAENNAMIEALTDPTTFVLNQMIVKLMDENKALSEQCPHEFHNGFCIYCYTKENK